MPSNLYNLRREFNDIKYPILFLINTNIFTKKYMCGTKILNIDNIY